MTDTEAPVEAVTAPATPAAKKAKAKKSKSTSSLNNHPKYREMVQAAITSLKERSGSSRQAIVKYIIANYKVGDNPKIVNNSVKLALRAGVTGNVLKQTSGTGASGSFKIGAPAKSEKKAGKKAAKPKSPKKKLATKAKKVVKKVTPKKVVKKVTPKKATKPKKVTPKKVAKPKRATPKKVTKPKKPAAKKAAAKSKKGKK